MQRPPRGNEDQESWLQRQNDSAERKQNSTDRRKGIFHIPLVSINYALRQQRAKHPLKHDFSFDQDAI